jgi:hypothetical protein
MKTRISLCSALIVLFCFSSPTLAEMKLLYEGTFEYGWSHSGVRSWGGNWGIRAQNEALEKIRRKVSTMVNLQELETFVKKDLNRSISGEGSVKKSFKISASDSMSSEDKERWVNRNNLLINISDVRIKQGTDWTKTRDERPLGGRHWDASATMLCDLKIYGKE